jgi:hypothetical protein
MHARAHFLMDSVKPRASLEPAGTSATIVLQRVVLAWVMAALMASKLGGTMKIVPDASLYGETTLMRVASRTNCKLPLAGASGSCKARWNKRVSNTGRVPSAPQALSSHLCTAALTWKATSMVGAR